MIKIVMPPAPGRPHPVDLWLCGHRYRESRQALAASLDRQGKPIEEIAARDEDVARGIARVDTLLGFG